MKKLAVLLGLALCSCSPVITRQYDIIKRDQQGTVVPVDKNRWVVYSDTSIVYVKFKSTVPSYKQIK